MIKIIPLTRQAFGPFGEVIEMAGTPLAINQGFADRYDDLCKLDGDGIKLSLFAASPRPQPIQINLMERHPLGSQAFYPLQNEDWLVLVCADPHIKSTYRCFKATGRQGVNYARGTWHFPLLVFKPSRFIVVDRKGPGKNLEEVMLQVPLSLLPLL
jgi:ureidoglycolate lyase